MNAYNFLKRRGVTRLCHFTKIQSLTHIISSINGILSSEAIRQDLKNVTDKARYDGELDYVCCSIQYPNSWFLNRAIERNIDSIFDEWVVLYINLEVLKYRNAKFCPCNASKSRGKYISDDMNNIELIFKDQVLQFSRTPNMLSCCPTDGQAEILIKDNIPYNCITGIVVGDVKNARQVYAMFLTLNIKQIPIYIAPDVLTTKWSEMVKRGLTPKEELFVLQEEEL